MGPAPSDDTCACAACAALQSALISYCPPPQPRPVQYEYEYSFSVPYSAVLIGCHVAQDVRRTVPYHQAHDFLESNYKELQIDDMTMSHLGSF